MENLSAQQIYDRVRDHLRAQRRPARRRLPSTYLEGSLGDACAYRGEGGTKCAAGCLIPDTHYSPDFEGATVASPPVQKALAAGGVAEEHLELVLRLQDVHDRPSEAKREEWMAEVELGLAQVAAAWGLVP